METIDVTARSDAPPEQVWSLLSGVEEWGYWGPFDRVELERPGRHGRGGLGSVRRLHVAGRVVGLRLAEQERGRRVAYELVSGLPVREHRAEVTLEADGDGTLISVRSSFRGRFALSERFVRPVLAAFVADTATRLARAAEQRETEALAAA